jgi:hypothetical protein
MRAKKRERLIMINVFIQNFIIQKELCKANALNKPEKI